MNKEKGLVIIYTGEGKGKTTAALGLAMRAAGYDKKILVVQFGKNSFSGELKSLERLKIKIIQGGKGFVKILGDKLPLKEHKEAAKETFDKLYKEVTGGKWDVVVADEIIGAVYSGLFPESLIVKLIKAKAPSLDLILTGHHASRKLIALADLVTEMKQVKHPFQKGILAKKGIDY
ncbi:cob(I)yrinic acid a,c-diamide adenosyltransferase [Candidatus Daviesbacteria bacterium]|nr:cob(I)yrinic acid a,c-diamide adenosyltransferase [Candidatus Daviesbacteria bacterium]